MTNRKDSGYITPGACCTREQPSITVITRRRRRRRRAGVTRTGRLPQITLALARSLSLSFPAYQSSRTCHPPHTSAFFGVQSCRFRSFPFLSRCRSLSRSPSFCLLSLALYLVRSRSFLPVFTFLSLSLARSLPRSPIYLSHLHSNLLSPSLLFSFLPSLAFHWSLFIFSSISFL